MNDNIKEINTNSGGMPSLVNSTDWFRAKCLDCYRWYRFDKLVKDGKLHLGNSRDRKFKNKMYKNIKLVMESHGHDIYFEQLAGKNQQNHIICPLCSKDIANE